MKHTLLTLLLALALPAALLAQDQDDPCTWPDASAMLTAGNGDIGVGQGYMAVSPRYGYEIPRAGGANALACVITSMGGLVDGQPRLIENSVYRPGPQVPGGLTADECAAFNRLFEITRDDIETYNTTGEVTDNLREWPWRAGAPVVDGDGDPDNYDLAAGDRPALMGHQMFWWVMHDDPNRVPEPWQSLPLNMEIQVTAFAFDQPRSHVGNTTFFRYKLTYHGEAPLEDAFFSLFPEVDLGAFRTTFEGADTTRHLFYAYDLDNENEGYGTTPPALGFTFMPTNPEGRALAAKGGTGQAFPGLHTYINTEPYGGAEGRYNVMRGRWGDGQPMTYGHDGRSATERITTIAYPGDPVTGEYWSMMNIDGQGNPSPYATYSNSLVSTGPFNLETGQSQEIGFAIVWSRGQDHLDSVTRLKADVDRLHQYADVFYTPHVDYGVGNTLPPQRPDPLGFAHNYPNPFTDATTIQYSLPQAMQVRLAVYDVLGREVATLVDAHQEGGLYSVPFAAGSLPPGVYLYRIEMDHLQFSKRMMLIR